MSSAVHMGLSHVLRRRAFAMIVLVHGDVEVARWPLMGRVPPDLSVVEELARLQLAARRLGYSVRLLYPCVELCDLLRFLGVAEIVGSERGGTDEVLMPDDPVA